MSRLRKGDTVAVISGRDRGKRGKILSVLPKDQTALVERLNLVKHFERRSQTNQAGGVLEREAPLALDKLALVCPRCSRPSRVGYSPDEGGPTGAAAGKNKARICKRCHEVI